MSALLGPLLIIAVVALGVLPGLKKTTDIQDDREKDDAWRRS